MKILCIDKNHPKLVEGLKEAGFDVEEDYQSSKEEIMNKISDYDGLVIRSRIPVDQEFLQKAIHLKVIGRVGAGLENIDLEYAKEKGITVFNAPEGNRDSVGEHALGMLLMLMHRLRIADAEMRQGIWKREENRGDELKGKTVGIIGYGNMGKAFARRLKGFGTRTICYDIQEGVGDENAVQVSLEELFDQADILSLHTPQTPETLGMINYDFISSFRKPFYFVNTARGTSVATEDLVRGMKEGRIKGVCLDVHEIEKSSFEGLNLKDLPAAYQYLIHSEKAVLAPHIAGWTRQSKEKLARVIVEKMADWKKFHKLAT